MDSPLCPRLQTPCFYSREDGSESRSWGKAHPKEGRPARVLRKETAVSFTKRAVELIVASAEKLQKPFLTSVVYNHFFKLENKPERKTRQTGVYWSLELFKSA